MGKQLAKNGKSVVVMEQGIPEGDQATGEALAAGGKRV